MTTKRNEFGLTMGTQALCYTALVVYAGVKITGAVSQYLYGRKALKCGTGMFNEGIDLVKKMYEDIMKESKF